MCIYRIVLKKQTLETQLTGLQKMLERLDLHFSSIKIKAATHHSVPPSIQSNCMQDCCLLATPKFLLLNPDSDSLHEKSSHGNMDPIDCGNGFEGMSAEEIQLISELMNEDLNIDSHELVCILS